MVNKKVKHAGLSTKGDLMALPGMEDTLPDVKRAHLGTRIRALREKLNLTQEDLASLCDVTKSAVSFWETGQVKTINLETWYLLLDALGVKAVQAEFLVFGPEGRRKPGAKRG